MPRRTMKKSSFLVFVILISLVVITFRGCQQGDTEITPFNIYRNLEYLQRRHAPKRKLPEIDDSPLAKLRQQGQLVIPSKDRLLNMSTSALTDTLHSYLGSIDFFCKRILLMGNIQDGGWEICDDEEYRPIRPCLVYSFGIGNDFSFDDYTANNYGCQVFSFDPSMEKESHQRSNLVMFFKLGIDGEDYKKNGDPWEVHTVTSFRKMFGHDQPLDVLKMDIEATEWRVLPQIVKSGESRRIRQLLVEYHCWSNMRSREQVLTYLNVLKDIYDAGFRKFYAAKNPGCFFEKNERYPVQRTDCYEVHYVNINFQP